MNDLINEYLNLVKCQKIEDRDILTKYLSLFMSKYKTEKFLKDILEILIKIIKDNRIDELRTNIIEYINNYNLADYDLAFLLNIVFYPKDYLEKYHDDYYFDMYKYCYVHVGNEVKSTHDFAKLCDIFHTYLQISRSLPEEKNSFFRSLMLMIICYYWLEKDKFTLDVLNNILNKINNNLIYYFDLFYTNGFFKDGQLHIDNKILYDFISELFFLKGDEFHEPIRK